MAVVWLVRIWKNCHRRFGQPETREFLLVQMCCRSACTADRPHIPVLAGGRFPSCWCCSVDSLWSGCWFLQFMFRKISRNKEYVSLKCGKCFRVDKYLFYGYRIKLQIWKMTLKISNSVRSLKTVQILMQCILWLHTYIAIRIWGDIRHYRGLG
jgi:hypothetical protein